MAPWEAVETTAVETVQTTGIASAYRIEGELQRGAASGVARCRPVRVTRQRLSRPSRTASRTGGAMRSAASRSSASGPRSWTSTAAPP